MKKSLHEHSMLLGRNKTTASMKESASDGISVKDFIQLDKVVTECFASV